MAEPVSMLSSGSVRSTLRTSFVRRWHDLHQARGIVRPFRRFLEARFDRDDGEQKRRRSEYFDADDMTADAMVSAFTCAMPNLCISI